MADSDYTIFPSIIPDSQTYGTQEIMQEVEASVLQGIAAAHGTDKVNGQSSAWEIADFLSGNHTRGEIDGMVSIIQDAEPPRSEVSLAPAIKTDGNLSQY